MGFSTKRLLEKVSVSEATLRRWISEGNRIPELNNAKKDWRGWRIWEDKHVEAIIKYKKSKMNDS
jgi:predicted site-specific integrase-resolvase